MQLLVPDSFFIETIRGGISQLVSNWLYEQVISFLIATYVFIMISIILNFLMALSACGLLAGRIIISPSFTR